MKRGADQPRLSRRQTIAQALDHLFPLIERFDREAILDHAEDSPGLVAALPETAAWLSAVAWIRHRRTDYDTLLADGYDRESARHFTLESLNEVLASWGSRRRISDEDGQDDSTG